MQSSCVQVDQAAVLASVQQLIGCLIAATPALECSLAKGLISRTGPADSPKYVGVLPTLAKDPQDPAGVKDLPRFAWNYLAGALATGAAKLANGASYMTLEARTRLHMAVQGVLARMAKDPQDPAGVKDLPRFAWSYLAAAGLPSWQTVRHAFLEADLKAAGKPVNLDACCPRWPGILLCVALAGSSSGHWAG